MNNEILSQFFSVKSSTIDEVKILLQEIKNQKNTELLKQIKKLEDELKKIKKAKRYGLVFEEKPEEFEKRSKNSLPLLKEIKELEIKNPPICSSFSTQEKNSPSSLCSVSPSLRGIKGEPTNLIIEGDNFHSLSCLKYTHQNKIDVIYIDPPYNTGNKDFIYNDRFVDKEDSYRHSKWLSFMKKRLRLAKDLLSEKGVIFISIDDNEQAQLKMLCDEIFGEENFIEIFCWNKTTTPPSLSNKSRNNIEYILCYEKNRNNSKYFGKRSGNSDAPLLNTGNGIKKLIFPIGSIKFKTEDGIYRKGIYDNLNVINDFEVKNSYNITEFIAEGEFKWSQENLNKERDLCKIKL